MKINFDNKEYEIKEEDLIITSDIDNNIIKKYLEYSELAARVDNILSKSRVNKECWEASSKEKLIGIYKSERAKTDKLIVQNTQRYIELAFSEADLEYAKTVFSSVARAYEFKIKLQLLLAEKTNARNGL